MEEDVSSSDEYFTAEEDNDCVDVGTTCEFVVWTSRDGTVWYLPAYFRAEDKLL